METLNFHLKVKKTALGNHTQAITGVVASGNLEILIERREAHDKCVIEVKTASHGFADIWQAVLNDFVDARPTGGLHISINDGGARPDTVLLRLTQAVRLLEDKNP